MQSTKTWCSRTIEVIKEVQQNKCKESITYDYFNDIMSPFVFFSLYLDLATKPTANDN